MSISCEYIEENRIYYNGNLHGMQWFYVESLSTEQADIYPLLKLSLSLQDVILKALQIPPLHHLSVSGHFLLFLKVLKLIRQKKKVMRDWLTSRKYYQNNLKHECKQDL